MTSTEIQASITKLEAALARGELRVQFADRLVEYKSTSSLIEALAYLRGQLANTNTNGRRKQSWRGVDGLLMLTAARRAVSAALASFRNVAAAGAAVYEAASQSRRMAGFRPRTVSPNSVLDSLATSRDRSRSMVRDNG